MTSCLDQARAASGRSISTVIRARQSEIEAELSALVSRAAALIDERDKNDAELRMLERLGIDIAVDEPVAQATDVSPGDGQGQHNSGVRVPPVDTDTCHGARAMSRTDQVRAYLADHPDATAREIAEGIGVSPEQVYGIVAKHGINIRRVLKRRTAQKPVTVPPADDGAESRRRKYGVPENDAVPIRLPIIIRDRIPDAVPSRIPTIIRERVAARHKQKPNWTATLIAKDLGIRRELVLAVLADMQVSA
jgi:hypothetical protein